VLRKITLAFNSFLVNDDDAVFRVFNGDEVMLDWDGVEVKGSVGGKRTYEIIYETPDDAKKLPITIVAIGITTAGYVKIDRIVNTDEYETIIAVKAPKEKYYKPL